VFHTAFTYHRTWEKGLEEVTRVSSSGPSFFSGDERVQTRWLVAPGALTTHAGTLKSNQPIAFWRRELPIKRSKMNSAGPDQLEEMSLLGVLR
jgi:hypothetical protein